MILSPVKSLFLHCGNLSLNFVGKVFFFLLKPFAHFVANESSYGNLFADLSGSLDDYLFDGLARIFDVFLIEKAVVFIESFDSSFNHFVDDLFGLALFESLRS